MSGVDPRIAQRRTKVAESRVRRGLVRTLWLVGLLALAALVAWLLRSPYFSVSEVMVAGAARSEVEGALAAVGIVEGRPLILLDLAAAESALRADPWIAEADVARDWPDRVVVVVRERFGVAWVETAAGWYHVAGDGVPLESGAPSPQAPRLLVPGLLPEDLSGQRLVLGALEFLESLRADLAGQTVLSGIDGELVAVIGSLVVRLGNPEEMAAKARALAAVMDTGPEPGSTITLVAPSRPAVLPPEAGETEEG